MIDVPELHAELGLDGALERIAARAADLDRSPGFPADDFADLLAAGVPQAAAFTGEGGDRFAVDVAVVRAVAAADGSTARILDGHLNGVERLGMLAEDPLRSDELAGVASGELLLGVWGADPAPGEGEPAHVVSTPAGRVLRGAKTFCSGAGGVHRALIVAPDDSSAGRRIVYLDPTHPSVAVDRDWYRASGLRSSESHRVEFHDTPVLALLGDENELVREPWFSRDAVRTSATWAGLADAIITATLDALDPSRTDEIRHHMLGQMRIAQGTIDRWLEHAVDVLSSGGGGGVGAGGGSGADTPAAADVSAATRIAISDNARRIASLAASITGSRALIGGGTLDRARRDLDLFLLQHRLDPKLVSLGASWLAAHGKDSAR